MKQVFSDIEGRMKRTLDHLQHDLKHIATGRASLALLEGVTVDYYGSQVPLTQVANVSVPDAALLVAQPYDPSQGAAIERAIQKADLGVNVSFDGKVIRIAVPGITEARRQELVKKAQELAEQARNAIHQSRQEGIDQLKKMEKEHAISQDDERRGVEEVQTLDNRYLAEINNALLKKTSQL